MAKPRRIPATLPSGGAASSQPPVVVGGGFHGDADLRSYCSVASVGSDGSAWSRHARRYDSDEDDRASVVSGDETTAARLKLAGRLGVLAPSVTTRPSNIPSPAAAAAVDDAGLAREFAAAMHASPGTVGATTAASPPNFQPSLASAYRRPATDNGTDAVVDAKSPVPPTAPVAPCPPRSPLLGPPASAAASSAPTATSAPVASACVAGGARFGCGTEPAAAAPAVGGVTGAGAGTDAVVAAAFAAGAGAGAGAGGKGTDAGGPTTKPFALQQPVFAPALPVASAAGMPPLLPTAPAASFVLSKPTAAGAASQPLGKRRGAAISTRGDSGAPPVPDLAATRGVSAGGGTSPSPPQPQPQPQPPPTSPPSLASRKKQRSSSVQET